MRLLIPVISSSFNIMKETFETFKPKNEIVKKFVDYYYLDIKPVNKEHKYECFPHFNNTISFYKSHIHLDNGDMLFEEKATPFQIFTPLREKVLHVKQLGPVHRVVIVFHPLGIQQFYKALDFSTYQLNTDFLASHELELLFATINVERLGYLLDSFLERRFETFKNLTLEKSLVYIFANFETFSVTKMAKDIGVSRQHINRLFQRNLGVSVKKFHEIVLFRRSITKKLFEDTTKSFTELAYTFNFNDQSHFNKTYKNLTHTSPRLFFAQGTILGKEDTFWHVHPKD